MSSQLTAEFGKGFDASNLYKMSQFYRAFPNLDALRLNLSWTHYRLLLRVDSLDARLWYMDEAAAQNWNTRALDRQIGTLYSVLHGNEQLFATKYKLVLPSEEELRAELLREQDLIASQALAASTDAPAQRATKAKRKTKGATT